MKSCSRYNAQTVVFVPENTTDSFEEKGAYADSTLFNLIGMKFISGDVSSAFEPQYSIVLSRSMARKIYNEEDPSDESTCYTIEDTVINPDIIDEKSLIPYKKQTGEIDYTLGANLERIWDQENYLLNPTDTTPCTFTDFYIKWIGEVGTVGSVYSTTSDSLQGTADTIDNNRQMVVGVSSDEELTNMIRYQSAYNASSRYINVVSTMIDYLLNSL